MYVEGIDKPSLYLFERGEDELNYLYSEENPGNMIRMDFYMSNTSIISFFEAGVNKLLVQEYDESHEDTNRNWYLIDLEYVSI